ncbi:MAG TPA: helix-turn-helix domain-containing protein [Pyrinomonadaceae bacterium]|nr:helix-turn-helix domain-containing protein [Pyrinomonadaceae bacterium]
MNSTATWETEAIDTAITSGDNGDNAARNTVATVRDLAMKLLSEVQGINEVSSLTLESGFDFYEEVSRFEIDLIKRALLQTGGHQVRAAKILNLKVTTLNSKIKHYNISLAGFSNVYPLVDPNQRDERQTA